MKLSNRIPTAMRTFIHDAVASIITQLPITNYTSRLMDRLLTWKENGQEAA